MLRKVALILGACCAIVALAFVVVVSIGVRVDLGSLRAPFQTLASTALGRNVTLDGPMVLIPTWSPTVEIQGLRIGNPEGWPSTEFARMNLARITVGVLPVLLGRAVIRELTAEGVSVLLEQTEDGKVNWLPGIDGSVAEGPEDSSTEAPPFDPRKFFIRSAAVEKLALSNIQVEYHDAVAGSRGRFELASLRGALGTHQPLRISLSGTLDRETYEVSVKGGAPVDLLKSGQPWPIELTMDIADTKLEIKTVVDEPMTLGRAGGGNGAVAPRAMGRRFGKLEVRLNAESLESLERLLPVDLPPWGPYGVGGTVEAFEGGRFKGEIALEVGTSALQGTIETTLGEPPRVDVTLASPSVQLDDFDTQGWSLTQEQDRDPAQETVEVEEAVPTEDSGGRAAILSPEVLRSVNGSLSVSVDRVASGADRLGKGHFTLTLEAGRLSLEPFELEVPGGAARLALDLHATEAGTKAEIRADLDRFDYGILARRLDPESEMRGLVGLSIAIEANSPAGSGLMGYANGRVDFAVFPENLDAGLVDLWAVNLITAAASAVDSEESRLNCLVGLFDLESGVMRERSLLLDTSNMTVGGTVKVDFKSRQLKVLLVPKAKEPEFFSAATPVRLDGSFEDFGIGVRVTDILRSVVSMATSVVHVPIRRIFDNEETKDDLEECLEALKREASP